MFYSQSEGYHISKRDRARWEVTIESWRGVVWYNSISYGLVLHIFFFIHDRKVRETVT